LLPTRVGDDDANDQLLSHDDVVGHDFVYGELMLGGGTLAHQGQGWAQTHTAPAHAFHPVAQPSWRQLPVLVHDC